MTEKINFKFISNFDDLNNKNLDEFVENHSGGNIFQTSFIFKSFESTKNNKPFVYILLNNFEEIIGVLAGVTISYSHFGGTLTRRAVIMGGPLVKDNNQELVEKLLLFANNSLKSKVLYVEIRNFMDVLPLNDAYQKANFRFHDHLNYLINLNVSKEEFIRSIHKSKWKTIQKAEKNGLTFDIIDNNNLDHISNAYEVISLVYNRLKLPLPPKELFVNCIRESKPGAELKIFTVSFDTEVIGVRIALLYKSCIYGWYAGSDSKYYKLFPNDFLAYKTLEWGILNGFLTFDFGGAGKPNVSYGVREFKSKFGGKLVNYGRYITIYHPIAFSVIKTLFNYRRKLKVFFYKIKVKIINSELRL